MSARLIPFPAHKARATPGSLRRLAEQELDAFTRDIERALAENARIMRELEAVLL